ncbi:DUF1697 domain-containing protein [Streptomyces fragilis]|uniref:DUF1697 domain-containing protein n=1 Tax=Streptomyces fragilis TaxID=67301 RepID=A0ABV2YGX6_9ACTN|nr:DUF1697 domain-containing protein [Streptomyces fragilis]
MTRYAALLRGVNVGGGRKMPMAELRAVLEELGHRDVRTYLQSGQAVFTAEDGDEEALAAELGAALGKRFAYTCEVLVRDHAYLAGVVAGCPFPAAELEGRQLHVTFLDRSVDEDRYADVDREAFLPEEFRIGDRAVYLYLPDGMGRSKLADRLSGPRLVKGLIATTRNWNTVLKLDELTSAP